METSGLLLVFAIIGIIGFLVMKKVDVYLETSQNRSKDTLKSNKDVIRIACENPIMLTSISEALENTSKEFADILLYFYTGCASDIQKMLEDERADIILLLEDADMGKQGDYGRKASTFVPNSMTEPLTGLTIEPIESQQATMYVFWNERHITEKQRKLLFNI